MKALSRSEHPPRRYASPPSRGALLAVRQSRPGGSSGLGHFAPEPEQPPCRRKETPPAPLRVTPLKGGDTLDRQSRIFGISGWGHSLRCGVWCLGPLQGGLYGY